MHALHTNTTASWCCQQIGKWISSNFTFRRCSLGFHWVKYIVLAVVLFLVAFHFYCMEQTNKLIAVTASEIEKKKKRCEHNIFVNFLLYSSAFFLLHVNNFMKFFVNYTEHLKCHRENNVFFLILPLFEQYSRSLFSNKSHRFQRITWATYRR